LTINPTSELGRGAAGVVYDALLDSAAVAVKVPLSTDDDVEAMLFDELIALNKINHPCCNRIIGVCKDSPHSSIMIVLQLCEKENLLNFIKRTATSPPPFSQMARYSLDILSVLRYLHAFQPEPLLHRDLKSANIFFTDGFRQNIQVCDFGLSATSFV